MTGRLTVSQKKWFVAAHILFACTWLGTSVVWLVLLITAATTTDPGMLKAAYGFMNILDVWVVRVSAITVTTTGLLMCLLTQWRLFQYRWLIVKELIAVGVMLYGATIITIQKLANDGILFTQGMAARSTPAFVANQRLLLVETALDAALLISAVVIAVFKPWGKRHGQDQTLAT